MGIAVESAIGDEAQVGWIVGLWVMGHYNIQDGGLCSRLSFMFEVAWFFVLCPNLICHLGFSNQPYTTEKAQPVLPHTAQGSPLFPSLSPETSTKGVQERTQGVLLELISDLNNLVGNWYQSSPEPLCSCLLCWFRSRDFFLHLLSQLLHHSHLVPYIHRAYHCQVDFPLNQLKFFHGSGTFSSFSGPRARLLMQGSVSFSCGSTLLQATFPLFHTLPVFKFTQPEAVIRSCLLLCKSHSYTLLMCTCAGDLCALLRVDAQWLEHWV